MKFVIRVYYIYPGTGKQDTTDREIEGSRESAEEACYKILNKGFPLSKKFPMFFIPPHQVMMVMLDVANDDNLRLGL